MTLVGFSLLMLLPLGDGQSEIKRLRKDINLLNLLNGLHLNNDQLAKLRSVHQRLRAARARAKPPGGGELRARKQRILALKQLRDSLLHGKRERTDLRQEISQPLDRRGPVFAQQLAEELHKTTQDCVNRVLEFLTPEQREILVAYKSCLVPPKHLLDPVRVGQASDKSYARRLLEKIRRVPAWRFRRGETVSWLITFLQSKGGSLTDPQVALARQSLGRIVAQARALSDAEFAMQADTLAEQLVRWDRHHCARKNMEKAAPRVLVRQNIASFLLDPRIPALLEERARVEPATLEGSLESIPAAENCDEGCAVPEKKAKRGRTHLQDARLQNH
ncbi:MAG: hypothetical protein ACE5F1_15070 [Planctomycetota bacterium]